MLLGLTAWEGRIAPVFDVCRQAVVFEIRAKEIVARSVLDLSAAGPVEKIDHLVAKGVETLICGAITRPVHAVARPSGLMIVAFITGEIDEVVEAFIGGTLRTPSFAMPGCGRRRHRFRGGHGRGH